MDLSFKRSKIAALVVVSAVAHQCLERRDAARRRDRRAVGLVARCEAPQREGGLLLLRVRAVAHQCHELVRRVLRRRRFGPATRETSA